MFLGQHEDNAVVAHEDFECLSLWRNDATTHASRIAITSHLGRKDEVKHRVSLYLWMPAAEILS